MQPQSVSDFQDGILPDDCIIDDVVPGLSPDATFRDRLVAKFSPTDVVEVKNIDTEDYSWFFMPEENEKVVPNADRTGYHTYRKRPEQFTIVSGEVMPLMGSNAYVMIEGLFKKVAMKKAIAEDKKTNVILQPDVQDEYINKIVMEALDPITMSQRSKTVPIVATTDDSLEADLGLTETLVRRGRPARAN
jgi:hypothetical protein